MVPFSALWLPILLSAVIVFVASSIMHMLLLILVWVFILGSIFGSFFNVVVHRLPLGLSLLHPPSRCPACEHPIRWRDNLPVVGWLLLRGRCAKCV